MARSRAGSRRGSTLLERTESTTKGSPERKASAVGSPRGASMTNNVKVMVRVRPFNKREIEISREANEDLKCVVEMTGNVTSVLDAEDDFESVKAGNSYEYDECFWSIPEDTCERFDMSPNGFADQEDLYDKSGKLALENAWGSYNTCIFAYGQTGSGKSYSMLGTSHGEHMGISPRIVENLFKQIEIDKVEKPKTIYKVEVTFLEIYNEQVKDLFAKNKNADYAAVKIRQHPLYGVQVHGLESKIVGTDKECKDEMEHGIGQRALASTKMNATSSRSHAIFQIHIYTSYSDTKQRGHATINLVDLAGSERIGKTGATGKTADEGKSINLSLSTLRNKGAKKVPPYRESMLTWVLKDSLGGNSKTMMICTISPHKDNLEDTVSTLRYGLKAKAIVCKAIKQEVAVDKQANALRAQIAELEAKLKNAKDEPGNVEEVKELQELLELERNEFFKVQEDVRAMQEREVELRGEVLKEKQNKFASAFRSAFVLEKGKMESKKLMEKLEAEKKDIEDAKAELKLHFERTQHDLELKQEMIQDQELELELAKNEMVERRSELNEVTQRLESESRRRQSDAASTLMQTRRLLEEIGIDDYEGVHELDEVKQHVVRKFSVVNETLVKEVSEKKQMETELSRLQDEIAFKDEHFRQQLKNLETALERERESGEDAEATFRRTETMLKMEAQSLRERLESELRMTQEKLEIERKEALRKETEHAQLTRAAETELDDLRKLVKTLQAELYVSEEAHTDLAHRKDHYKKQCLLLREMHEADTKIIKSLSSERCISGDVMAAAVKMTATTGLGEKARALQPIIEDKADTINKLTGALGHYQEAAAEWMSSPNVVGAGSRTRREERAKDKLAVWLQDTPQKAQQKQAHKEVYSSLATWQTSPFGVRSGSPETRRRKH